MGRPLLGRDRARAARVRAQALTQPVVIGADGFVGRHVAGTVGGVGHLGRADLDLRVEPGDELERALRGHSHVVIAAGVTSIAACERDPAGTRLVNVDATLGLARRALAAGVAPVAFSSDYVFDGRDPPYDDDGPIRPLNEYGRQKADLEEGFAALGDSLVVRLSKVYGAEPGDGTLLDEMAGALRRGQVVRAARDQVFNPIVAADVVAGVLALCDAGRTGIVNLSGPEDWSRVDLARAVSGATGADAGLVEEISLDDLREAFVRPKDTRMRTGRLTRLTDVRPRGIQPALDALA